MKKNVFIVCGYGVPQDIFTDTNYKTYLNEVFNTIYAITTSSKLAPVIIASGGKTDCFKPYKRTEAQEMVRYLKLLTTRSFLTSLTKHWKFLSETKALSTLENLLFSENLLKKNHIEHNRLYIFCEKTRERKVATLARNIFKKQIQIIPLDFDISTNRYLDSNFLRKKEERDLKHALWALKNKEHLKIHHRLFQDKITVLRKAGSENHVEAVRLWWEEQLSQFS